MLKAPPSGSRRSVRLSIALAAALVLLLALSVSAFAVDIVVTSDNPGGWVSFRDNAGNVSSGDFVSGPGTPPAGSGSFQLQLATAPSGHILVNPLHAGVSLGSITSLQYNAYRSSNDPGTLLLPSLFISVDRDGVGVAYTGWQGRLVFEPYLANGNVYADDTWYSIDAMSGAGWWASNGAVATATGCAQATPCTWAALVAALPLGTVHPTDAQIGFKAGSSWPGFVGSVDKFTIGVSGVDTVYDFEAACDDEACVVYDGIPNPAPFNVGSHGYEARSTDELGDEITLASGGRLLESFEVYMSSWACETGSGAGCLTTANATFAHPITLNIYASPSGNPNLPGALIHSWTRTFDIPYRPSADPTCAGGTAWKASDGVCYNGLGHVVTFDNLGVDQIVLPDTFVYGIAYNTANHGAVPIGGPGPHPYSSLNVGYLQGIEPDKGADFEPGTLYLDSTWNGAYWVPNAEPLDTFQRNGPGAPGSLVVSVSTVDECSTECYVDPTGSDLNPGTESYPKQTIQGGVDAVTAGGTVHVANGSYSEPLTAGRVTVGKSLTLLAASHAAQLDGFVSILANVDDVTIDGFTILNGGAPDPSTHAGVYITGGGPGVNDNIVVTNNVLVGPGRTVAPSNGIEVGYGVTNLEISHNLIEKWRYGAYINPSVTSGDNVFMNTVRDVHTGFPLDGVGNISIRNNLFTLPIDFAAIGTWQWNTVVQPGIVLVNNSFPQGVIGVARRNQMKLFDVGASAVSAQLNWWGGAAGPGSPNATINTAIDPADLNPALPPAPGGAYGIGGDGGEVEASTWLLSGTNHVVSGPGFIPGGTLWLDDNPNVVVSEAAPEITVPIEFYPGQPTSSLQFEIPLHACLSAPNGVVTGLPSGFTSVYSTLSSPNRVLVVITPLELDPLPTFPSSNAFSIVLEVDWLTSSCYQDGATYTLAPNAISCGAPNGVTELACTANSATYTIDGQAPIINVFPSNSSVDENVAYVSTPFGASDSDGDDIVWSLVAGCAGSDTDNFRFTINPTSGVLTSNATFDFEDATIGPDPLWVCVQADDQRGSTDTEPFAITVINRNKDQQGDAAEWTAGDCNMSGVVNATDVSAIVLEIFDGDASSDGVVGAYLYSPYGTFRGSPEGCDANRGTDVRAADMLCTVNIIFGDRTCTDVAATAPASAQSATLNVPAEASVSGNALSVPITLNSHGNSIASASFELQLDASASFDSTDANADGVPDAITFNVPASYLKVAVYDAEKHTVKVALVDMSLPFTAIDGVIATVNVSAEQGSNIAYLIEGSVGNTEGRDVTLELLLGNSVQQFSNIFLPSVIR